VRADKGEYLFGWVGNEADEANAGTDTMKINGPTMSELLTQTDDASSCQFAPAPTFIRHAPSHSKRQPPCYYARPPPHLPVLTPFLPLDSASHFHGIQNVVIASYQYPVTFDMCKNRLYDIALFFSRQRKQAQSVHSYKLEQLRWC